MVHALEHRAAQRGVDARAELVEIERLGQIVVGAGFEPVDAVAHVAARGEHDDRHLGEAAQQRDEREAVDLRHHDVEHDAVRLPVAHDGEPVGAVDRGPHLEAFLDQADLEHLADALLVVDDRDAVRYLGSHRSIFGENPGTSLRIFPRNPWGLSTAPERGTALDEMVKKVKMAIFMKGGGIRAQSQ